MRQPQEWRELWLQAIGDIWDVPPDQLDEHIKETLLKLIARIQRDAELGGRIKGIREVAAEVVKLDHEAAQRIYEKLFQLEELARFG